jgi:AcrR family transcriptional regulator
VLRAAIVLISEHGMDGMTMRQVAHASGLSTGTINYHFTNKRGLILAALDAAPSVSVDVAPEDAGSALRALLRGFVLEDDERHAWWRFWIEVTAQAARDPDLRDRQRNRVLTQQQAVEELIARAVTDGQLRSDLDPALVSAPLLALAYGLVLQQLLSPDSATVRLASDALEGSLRELATI